MDSLSKNIKSVLAQALWQEKRAEEHCQTILDFADLNGFTEMIIGIRNDEIEHQKLVRELLDLLK